MECKGECHALFRRKEYVAIESGASELLWRKRIEKLEQLKVQQSNVIDKCLKEDNWTSWERLDHAIKELNSLINNTLSFELGLYAAHLKVHV